MARSQNGWPVLDADHTRVWKIPGTERTLRLAKGAAGFVLVHTALFFHENVEKLGGGKWDEWGWADRDIRGSTEISNHASGTAMDLNAVQHPLGVDDTFTAEQIETMHDRLRWMDDVVRWGQDYTERKDGMHFEINADRESVKALAKKLRNTELGERVAKANPVNE